MKLKKRPVDTKIADEGVWIEVYAEDGEYYGSYRVRYGIGDLKYRAAVAQIRKRLSKSEVLRLTGAKPDVALAQRVNIEAFCSALLVDWKDVPVDKLPPYSPEAAAAFFSEEAWLFDLISDEAENQANFRAETQAEAAKN